MADISPTTAAPTASQGQSGGFMASMPNLSVANNASVSAPTGNGTPSPSGFMASMPVLSGNKTTKISALTPATPKGFMSSMPNLSSVKPPPTDQGTSIKSPYFSGTTSQGGTLGYSITKDNSGKPFFAYRNPGDTSTTTDITRVATQFDPRVPQAMSLDSFYNPRAVANRAALKTAMGGTYSTELDHIIPLELSGSNDPSNLRIESSVDPTKPYSGSNETPTDPLENKLAREVVSGKISLFDAQTQMAQAKGTKLPWTGGHDASISKSGGFISDMAGFFNNLAGKVHDALGPEVHAETTTPTATTTETIAPHIPISPNPTISIPPTDPKKESVYLETQGKVLDTVSKQIDAENTKLINFGNTLKTEQAQVDTTNQDSVDKYNAMLSDYNSAVKSLQSKVDTFNSSIKDYQSRENNYNLSVNSANSDAYFKAGGATSEKVGPAVDATGRPIVPQKPITVSDLSKQNATISQEPAPTIVQRITNALSNLSPTKDFMGTNADQPARDAVVASIAKTTGQDPDVIDKNLTQYTKALGLRSEPTTMEVTQALLSLPVVTAIVANPIGATLGLAGYAGITAAEKQLLGGKELSDVISDHFNLDESTRSLLSLAEMGAKGGLLYGVAKGAPTAFDYFTKTAVDTYNMPKSVSISGQDVINLQNETGPEALKPLYKAAGLTNEQIKVGMKQGMTLNIPAEKVSTLVDQPWWGKVKAAITEWSGLPTSQTNFETGRDFIGNEKVKQGPAGLIEAPKSKSQFSSPQIRDLTPEEKPVLEKVNAVISGNSKTEVIAHTPSFVSTDGKERPLIFSKEIADKVKYDHDKNNKMSPENLVINANNWDYVIKNVDGNPDKINLIKQIPNSSNFLTIGANKDNGFFTVTHYETTPKSDIQLKNLLKNKGDTLDNTGRAPVPSFATSPEGAASQLGLSGVSADKNNLSSQGENVKNSRQGIFSKISGPGMTMEDAQKTVLKHIDPKTIDLMFSKEPIPTENGGKATGSHTLRAKPYLKSLIQLYEEGGKVGARTTYEEIGHELFSQLSDAEKAIAFDAAKKDISIFDKAKMKINGYYSSEYLEEHIVKKWAFNEATKAGYKGPLQKLFDIFTKLKNSIIDAYKKMKENWDNMPNKQGGFADFGFGGKDEELSTKKLEKANSQYTKYLQDQEVIASKNNLDLEHLKQERDILQEHLKNSPSRESIKNTNKLTGELPEVTGMGKQGSFSKSGDSMSTERGFGSSEEERNALSDYKSNQARLKEINTKISELTKQGVQFRNGIKNKNAFNRTLSRTTPNTEVPNEDYLKSINAKKEAIAARLAQEQSSAVTQFFINNPDILENYEDSGKLNEDMNTYIEEYTKNLAGDAQSEINLEDAQNIENQSIADKERKLDQIVEEYKQQGISIDRDILQENKGIVPPPARGGIRSPQFNLMDLKDIAMLRLNRDTLERGFEKIANPVLADKLNKFYTDKIRENDFKLTEWKNAIRKEVGGKMKELGIKANSKENAAVQKFGEGMISLHEVDREFPEMSGKIQDADRVFREVFDRELAPWNAERAKFGYKEVKPVGNRPYYRHYNKNNPWLGVTGSFFQSGELPTEIAGLTDNFNPGKSYTGAEKHRTGNKTKYGAIESLDDWLDSVGRQRFHMDSIQRGRALEKYIRAGAKVNPEVKLPNFVANLHEHTNFVAGKSGRFDRAVEELAGRKVVGLFENIKKAYGGNVIGANLASALTHSIPISFNLATVNPVGAVQGLFDTLTSPFATDFLKVDGITSRFLTRRYPLQFIRPNAYQSITKAISTPFDLVDRFISRLAVASKYYEGTHYGLSPEEAMIRADNYTGRVIGSRATGDLPNMMKNKTLGFFTQFQIEVNDNLSVLIHDIPRFSRENIPKGQKATDMIEKTDKNGRTYYEPRGNNYKKIALMFTAFAIFSHLVNHYLKALKGIGKGLDPIGLGLDLAGYNDDGIPFIPQKNAQDSTIGSRAVSAATDLLGELPGTNILTGSIPAASAFPNLVAVAQGKSTLGKEGLKSLSGLASPIGGGTQVQKTIEGIQAVNAGQTTTSNGNINTTVDKTIGNYVKGAIFGPSAFNNANGANKDTTDLINLLNAGKGQATVAAEAEFNKLQGMTNAQKVTELQDLNTKDPQLIKTLQTVADDKANGVTLNERLIKGLGVVNGERAKYIANKMNALPDKKSQLALLQRYADIKIVSEQVAEQLVPLLKIK